VSAREESGLVCLVARLTLVMLCGGIGIPDPAHAEVTARTATGFTVTHELVLPGRPEVIYDAMAGDIGDWWDHKFSKSPKAFYIEPWPGGGFFEIFDERGDGVRHATVTWAERGKRLRFDGGLGLAEFAVHGVHTYDYESLAGGDSTRIRLTVHMSGQIQEGWPGAVDQVWRHFLFDGLKPYVEAGRHLGKKPRARPTPKR
jgi:hypothetical protein